MTTHAGETRQGLLWKQEHLAPLPIPTGQPAKDLLNLIWRKNDVYLDIGSFAMAAGWLVLSTLSFIGFVVGLRAIAYMPPPGDLIMVVPAVGFLAFMWWLYSRTWRKPLKPPLRFNRQRREVCVTRPDGSFWFVPWERVHAVTPSATQLGPYGAGTSGALIIWLPLEGQEREPYHPDKEGWVMMTNPGGGTSAMAQWECIRSFMEVGPQAVPEPGQVGMKKLKEMFWQEIEESRQRLGTLLLAIIWEFFLLLVFNPLTYHWLASKKLAHLPDLTAPEAVEWSKPLPPEKWAKRTPELERAIAEREAELVGTAKDPQPTVQA
jgi:hypothetical protein